jgi:GT2 family glycosyltransferase
MAPMTSAEFGAVAIGRNEGERLKQCLRSLSQAARVVYVDSGSSDGSAEFARSLGVEVVALDTTRPFTAARARNAGLRRLQVIAPSLGYVQFIDGDCEMNGGWPAQALALLEAQPQVAVAFGRRRERHPERSVYNWLCDREWDTPPGEAKACGGDAMMRSGAVERVGCYRGELIAGEEPELCVRLRAAGWQIRRLDGEMTLHDAAMTRFSQWWRRHTRSGYAFAQGASLHGAPPERHWVWETRRALLWGALLPIALLLLTALAWPWGLAGWLIYPLQLLRRYRRLAGPPRQRAALAWFELLSRFPESRGVIQFTIDRIARRRRGLIEYK